jgi:hypothetical protein
MNDGSYDNDDDDDSYDKDDDGCYEDGYPYLSIIRSNLTGLFGLADGSKMNDISS